MIDIDGLSAPYHIHIGCNTTKITGWVNIDARETTVTDLVHNCANLKPFDDESVSTIYSNAFFEHLAMQERSELLDDMQRVLTNDGFVYFTGIPDFETIARCYLEKQQGHVSPRFDLFEVYRYTHGDPEHKSEWWIEQLHKTLFDVDTLKKLLEKAGFKTSYIYRYPYKSEAHAVNLGFFARKSDKPFSKEEVLPLIQNFAPICGANLNKLELDL